MGPRDIVRAVRAQGLDGVGVCDHNSARNAPAIAAACRDAGLRCWPGIEVTTVEEAHILWLHDSAEAAERTGEWIYAHLPDIPNVPATFGDQVVVDAGEVVQELLPRLLSNATTLSLAEVAHQVALWGGLLVAAHIDRPMYSVVSQLGMLPDDVPFDALEYSARSVVAGAVPDSSRPCVVSSDAHRLEEIGCCWTEVQGTPETIAELRAALLRGTVLRTGSGGTARVGRGYPRTRLPLHRVARRRSWGA